MPTQAPIIAPSLLAADCAALGAEARDALAGGADWLHLDVMDQHYVPNLTFGPLVCQALRKAGIEAPLDVHLMVSPVDDLIRAFADAGADWITIHPDATTHVDRSLRLIADCGAKPGLALNPATGAQALDYTLEQLDQVLLMSVNPGFGGQAFLPAVLDKIVEVRARIEASARPVRLAVDGGIDASNIARISVAGADTFIAGTAIFGQSDRASAIATLRGALAGA